MIPLTIGQLYKGIYTKYGDKGAAGGDISKENIRICIYWGNIGGGG